ncbi:MAG: hypothetical protein KGQ70_09930, partial [Alphaproteobacteria bacterium]|nr:hypothetical protein [Alphaproteobacteria bacterium]
MAIVQTANFFSIQEIQDLIKSPEVIAVGLTAVLDVIRRILIPKAFVAWGTGHQFTFSIPQNKNNPTLLLHTRSIIVKNTGRSEAREIEIYLNFV